MEIVYKVWEEHAAEHRAWSGQGGFLEEEVGKDGPCRERSSSA